MPVAAARAVLAEAAVVPWAVSHLLFGTRVQKDAVLVRALAVVLKKTAFGDMSGRRSCVSQGPTRGDTSELDATGGQAVQHRPEKTHRHCGIRAGS
eukprot:scaffold5713_cov124-Isochrysis_galbana.AAC.2